MSVSCVPIKTGLLHECTATHCTREAATFLTVLVVHHVYHQTISRFERRSAFSTRKPFFVQVVLDVTQKALTVLEGRAAQVARQARGGFNTKN